MIASDLAVLDILEGQHLADTHKAGILHTIIKDIRHPDQAALAGTSMDTEGQTANLDYV